MRQFLITSASRRRAAVAATSCLVVLIVVLLIVSSSHSFTAVSGQAVTLSSEPLLPTTLPRTSSIPLHRCVPSGWPASILSSLWSFWFSSFSCSSASGRHAARAWDSWLPLSSSTVLEEAGSAEGDFSNEEVEEEETVSEPWREHLDDLSSLRFLLRKVVMDDDRLATCESSSRPAVTTQRKPHEYWETVQQGAATCQLLLWSSPRCRQQVWRHEGEEIASRSIEHAREASYINGSRRCRRSRLCRCVAVGASMEDWELALPPQCTSSLYWASLRREAFESHEPYNVLPPSSTSPPPVPRFTPRSSPQLLPALVAMRPTHETVTLRGQETFNGRRQRMMRKMVPKEDRTLAEFGSSVQCVISMMSHAKKKKDNAVALASQEAEELGWNGRNSLRRVFYPFAQLVPLSEMRALEDLYPRSWLFPQHSQERKKETKPHVGSRDYLHPLMSVVDMNRWMKNRSNPNRSATIRSRQYGSESIQPLDRVGIQQFSFGFTTERLSRRSSSHNDNETHHDAAPRTAVDDVLLLLANGVLPLFPEIYRVLHRPQSLVFLPKLLLAQVLELPEVDHVMFRRSLGPSLPQGGEGDIFSGEEGRRLRDNINRQLNHSDSLDDVRLLHWTCGDPSPSSSLESALQAPHSDEEEALLQTTTRRMNAVSKLQKRNPFLRRHPSVVGLYAEDLTRPIDINWHKQVLWRTELLRRQLLQFTRLHLSCGAGVASVLRTVGVEEPRVVLVVWLQRDAPDSGPPPLVDLFAHSEDPHSELDEANGSAFERCATTEGLRELGIPYHLWVRRASQPLTESVVRHRFVRATTTYPLVMVVGSFGDRHFVVDGEEGGEADCLECLKEVSPTVAVFDDAAYGTASPPAVSRPTATLEDNRQRDTAKLPDRNRTSDETELTMEKGLFWFVKGIARCPTQRS